MKRVSLSFLIFALTISLVAQTNQLDGHEADWVAGTSGNTQYYNLQGTTAQNSRVSITGPQGSSIVAWQAASDGASGFNGGLVHDGVILDASKTYRMAFWVRSEGTVGCNNFTGFIQYRESDGSLISTSTRVDGSTTNWPYFYVGNLPEDQWFLIIAYLHPTTYTGGNQGGVYNPSNIDSNNPGVLPGASYGTLDYFFGSGETSIRLQPRAFMWACSTGELMQVANLRIDEVNGNEPTTLELLSGNTTPPPTTGGDSVWSVTGTNISYTSGDVAIGTASHPAGYKLAVSGKVISEEVRVQISSSWPDYVFKEGYDLPSLDEVRDHINTKGHLKNLPSAANVEEEGIDVGEMNRLLVEKIEELTLYILQQQEEIDQLKKQINKN